jgi:hypothetical protein
MRVGKREEGIETPLQDPEQNGIDKPDQQEVTECNEGRDCASVEKRNVGEAILISAAITRALDPIFWYFYNGGHVSANGGGWVSPPWKSANGEKKD